MVNHQGLEGRVEALEHFLHGDPERKIDGVAFRVASVEEALRGDMRGNPGALQSLIRVMRDLYEGHDALIPSVKQLQKERNRTVGWISGAVAVGTIAAQVIIYIITHGKAFHP